jgi:hypothetical protein
MPNGKGQNGASKLDRSADSLTPGRRTRHDRYHDEEQDDDWDHPGAGATATAPPDTATIIR